MMISDVKLGEKLVCTVCGKEFTVTEDTKYIAKGGYVCNWKCFLARVKEVELEKNNKTK